MSKFQPGDLAVIVLSGAAHTPSDLQWTNQRICQLVNYVGNTPSPNYAGKMVPGAWRVSVQGNAEYLLVASHCLRPIDGDGASWDAIEAITNWRPQKSGAEAPRKSSPPVTSNREGVMTPLVCRAREWLASSSLAEAVVDPLREVCTPRNQLRPPRFRVHR